MNHTVFNRSRFEKFLLVVLAAVFLAPIGSRAFSEQLSADEYGVKAAFLYNLAKFVDWPEQKLRPADAPLVIGVAGSEPVGRIRAIVKDKSIGSHKVEVRLVNQDEEFSRCHILFVSRSEKARSPGMLERAAKAGVLTVGETERFLESGGMIRFYLESDSLRLEIADESVRNAGLTIKASALSTLISKGIARLYKG